MPQPSQLDDALDALAIAVSIGLIVLVATGHSGPQRLVLALGFAFFVPGRAIVSTWSRAASWSQAALAMVLSIAVLALFSTVILWAHQWNPLLLFQIEAWPCVVVLGINVTRRHRRRSQAGQPLLPSWSGGGAD